MARSNGSALPILIRGRRCGPAGGEPTLSTLARRCASSFALIGVDIWLVTDSGRIKMVFP